MSAYREEAVLSVTHWNGDLFGVAKSRDLSFRFKNRRFATIGLEAALPCHARLARNLP